ncbi:MAG: GNAT family N-acetyltransferase [Candidatus Cryosericum sp.]
MQIANFTHSHIVQAQALAKQNYKEERGFVTALPQIDLMPDLIEFADNNMGVAAFENCEMVGFMCAYSAFDNAFGTTGVKGTWSPLHAHAAVGDREKIYKRLYQAAAEKWVAAGAASHAITLYAHERDALDSFFTYGFGLRCVDAIRSINDVGMSTEDKYRFTELDRNNAGEVTGLRNLLINHLGESPCFLRYPQMSESESIDRGNHRDSRIFTMNENDNLIAFIEIMVSGENFVCDAPDMMNICGAYLMPEYRGNGTYDNLLRFLMNCLNTEGYTRLGVDFESFNPTAWGFWLKHFAPYTHSVVRRIDEGATYDHI